MTNTSTLKELTCDQHVLFRVVYVDFIRGTRFLLPPPFTFKIVLTILIFARIVTEVDLRIESRPVSMHRAKM